MKRISVHAAFALAVAAAATVAAVQGWRLREQRQLNAEVVAAAQAVEARAAASAVPDRRASDPAAAAPPASSAEPSADPSRDPSVDPSEVLSRRRPREVRLAEATALARVGDFDAAFRRYGGLIEPGRDDALSRQAQYNLGNLVLRQGLASTSPAEQGPLVELAKQRYRDVLRVDPDDWDARYNLERALRVAPELHEAVAETANEPVERRTITLRGLTPGDLP